MSRHVGAVAALTLACGCAPVGPAPAPPATPPQRSLTPETGPSDEQAVDLDPGLACAHARVRCELGSCDVELHNECELPVVCDLTVKAECGDEIGAHAASAGAHDSVPVDTATTLIAAVDCGNAPPRNTRVARLKCR